MKHVRLAIAAVVAVAAVSLAGSVNIPGCPISGCSYTGPVNVQSTLSAGGGGGSITSNSALSGFSSNTSGTTRIGRSGGPASLNLYRTDVGGSTGVNVQVDFRGANSAGADTLYARMQQQPTSITSGSEIGRLSFFVNNAGSTEYLRLDPALVSLLNGAALGLSKSTTTAGPGATAARLQIICGTTAGTAKLVVYAGTSTTPSTLLDNIGSGFSGC